MDLFLVEAETAYLSCGRSPMSALSGFRAGQADIDDGTNGFEEASANPRDAAAVYYVRLWCRTRQGQSCLVVV